MSALTDPPRESFRLSMLLNDTRYRGLTFQFIALVLLIGSIAYLASNLFSNLAAAGLDISYEFLGTPAGYDINQRPIEYTSQSTHMRAAIVGILNTLIVAFLACVSATVLGVIAGVLRLSNNWLVSKLMAVYVEAFRNVPVLIWIIIIFTVMTASMPGPREFKGPDAEASRLHLCSAKGLFCCFWSPLGRSFGLIGTASTVLKFCLIRAKSLRHGRLGQSFLGHVL